MVNMNDSNYINAVDIKQKDPKYMILYECEEKKWADYVMKHPHGNIFQSPYMFEIYRKTTNYDPLTLFAIDEDTGELGGLLSAVVIYEKGGLLKSFSAHSVIQGGPLVLPGLEKTLVPLLIGEHDNLARRKAIYSETRNMFDVKEIIQNSNSYIFEEHLNFLINLQQTEQDLWKRLDYSRRKNINHAFREHVTIEELKNKDQLSIFYRLIEETYRKAKIPLVHISLFESAYDILFFNKMARFFLASHEGKFIGALVCLLYKDTVYAWYGGMAQQARGLQPFSLLIWHALKWGVDNGYHIFDFGGGGKPNIKYGPRDFKNEFGGELVNYGRHKRVFRPVTLKLTNMGFKIYQKLFL